MKIEVMRGAVQVLLVLAVLTGCMGADDPAAKKPPGFRDLVGPADRLEGFYDLYWRADTGKLYLHIKAFDEPFLYVSWLARGVGSNDLGLDRGQLGDTRVVRFRRSGPRVLLLQENLEYRAGSTDPVEQAAVAESFAFSVIGGFDIAAEAGSDNGVLIDATGFFLRDAHGVAATLAEKEEGDYKVREDLSALYLPRTRAFPDNTEVEAIVTLTGQPKGKHLPTVVPDPTHLSVHQHHSLVRLPAEGFEAVPFEPRAGYMDSSYGDSFQDYASAIHQPLTSAWLARHRLAKKDPSAAVSEAVEPIVYYLDPGAPEPVRSALLEGAAWWNQAFEAAGYRDAFQVRLLPEGADPMDVRYNVIQWVHRSTRGWSYGSSVRDPRTGEIIKGHVTLGSLRVRQDYMMGEGLLAPYGDVDRADEALDMALARLRQLSAHEVGHTLGLAHNFAASADGRASVMDYPHPLIKLDERGDVDLSDAYGVGIGSWDKRAILYGYQDFPAEVDAAAARSQILADTLTSGLHFVADADARGVGTAHPLGSVWDNGANAIDELERLGEVRRVVLENFSEAVIRQGRPLANLEEVLVPMYLLHRYQIAAAGKYLGGQYFSYAMRGDSQQPATAPVPVAEQRRALQSLLATLQPEYLALAPELVAEIPPRPPGFPANRELFTRATGSVFDPVAPAEAASQLTLSVLLNPQRAARMNRMRAADPAQPGYSLVLEELLQASWRKGTQSEQPEVQRAVNQQVLAALIDLAWSPEATPGVRDQARTSLAALGLWLVTQHPTDADWIAHYAGASLAIEKRLENPIVEKWKAPQAPPGSPIGAAP